MMDLLTQVLAFFVAFVGLLQTSAVYIKKSHLHEMQHVQFGLAIVSLVTERWMSRACRTEKA